MKRYIVIRSGKSTMQIQMVDSLSKEDSFEAMFIYDWLDNKTLKSRGPDSLYLEIKNCFLDLMVKD